MIERIVLGAFFALFYSATVFSADFDLSGHYSGTFEMRQNISVSPEMMATLPAAQREKIKSLKGKHSEKGTFKMEVVPLSPLPQGIVMGWKISLRFHQDGKKDVDCGFEVSIQNGEIVFNPHPSAQQLPLAQVVCSFLINFIPAEKKVDVSDEKSSYSTARSKIFPDFMTIRKINFDIDSKNGVCSFQEKFAPVVKVPEELKGKVEVPSKPIFNAILSGTFSLKSGRMLPCDIHYQVSSQNMGASYCDLRLKRVVEP